MALRQRLAELPLSESENVVTKSIKSAALQPRGQRPALGELGNKIHNNQTKNEAVAKKGEMGPPVMAKKKFLPKQNSTLDLKVAPVQKVLQVAAAAKPIQKVFPKKTAPIFTDTSDSYTVRQLSIIDPDENCRDDPQMVPEYLSDIYHYLHELEDKYPINKDFLSGHQSSPRMRAILVNWLVDVHQNFKLCLETLLVCVSIVDQYLQSNREVGRKTLQLVGTAALLVASKYEEMYLPELEDFTYICDDTFTKKQVLRMEIDILKRLNFNLGRPTAIHFLRRYNKIAQVTNQHHMMGKYLVELTLLEYKLAHVKPSLLAAAVCCLSIALLDEVKVLATIWTPTLQKYTSYEYNDFKLIILDLACMISKSAESKFQATRLKYAASKFTKISLDCNLSGPLIKRLVAQTPKLVKEIN